MGVHSAALKGYNCQKRSFPTAKLLIILVIFQNKSVCSTTFEFITQPADVSAKADTSASFQCTLKSTVAFSSANSYWVNGLIETLHHNDLYNVTTVSDIINRRVTSSLTINKLQRQMNHLYKCWIIISLLDDSRKIISSEFATLDVLYFLKNNEVHCRGPSSAVLQEGDQLSIECEGVQTNPRSVLRWQRPAIFSSFSQTGLILFEKIRVTTLIHNYILICIAESEVFLGQQATCSLGPFKVLHPLVVEVIPYQAEMTWPLVAEMTLQCIAEGYPEVKGYTWFCEPEEVFTQCSSKVPNLTIILHNVRAETILNISCEARNDVASARGSSTIHVRYIAESMIPPCRTSNLDLPQINHTREPHINYNVAANVVECSAKVNNIEPAAFRWYLEGLLIAENVGEHDLIKSPEGGSHIIVYNLQKIRRPGIVVCNIRFFRYHELRSEQLAACKLFDEIGNTPIVSFSIKQDQSPKTISTHFAATMKLYLNSTTTTSAPKELTDGMPISVIPILSASGLLFFVIVIIALMQKLKVCRCTGTRESDDPPPSPKGIHFNVKRSHSHDVQEDTCYEIPDTDLRPSTLINDRKLDKGISLEGRRHRNIDSILEEDSFAESILIESDSFDGDLHTSYLHNDERDSNLHHHTNRDIVEFMEGKVRSSYLKTRMAQTKDCERLDYESRIYTNNSSSSTDSSSL